MGDMGDDFRAMKEYKKSHRANTLEANTKAITELQAGGLPLVWLTPYQVRLHMDGKPRVDFYPSSNRFVLRWNDRAKTTTMYGGLSSFLNWYKKQTSADGVTCDRHRVVG